LGTQGWMYGVVVVVVVAITKRQLCS